MSDRTGKKIPRRGAREVEFEHQKYISIRVAARLAGLSHTTVYQWARKGRTPDGRIIVVIRDTLTNQILISEESILALLHDRFHPLSPVSEKSA